MQTDNLLVIDFDGTLVDLNVNRQGLRDSLTQLFAKHGLHSSFQPLLDSLQALLHELAQQSPVLARTLFQQSWQIINQAEKEAVAHSVLCPHAKTFLANMNDIPIVLYSNNHLETVLAALQHHHLNRQIFGQIIARTAPGSLKPSIQPLLEILSQGRQPKKIFVLGDHPLDMKVAQRLQADLSKVNVVPLALARNSAKHAALEGAGFMVADLKEAEKVIISNRSASF